MTRWVVLLAALSLVGCSNSKDGSRGGLGPDGDRDGSVVGDGSLDGDGDGGGGGRDGGGRDGSGNECERIDVRSDRVPPNALIVLDRSLSMITGVNRWEPAVNAVNGFVSALESQVHFGLMTFASDNDCGAGTVRVQPALENASSIASTLASTTPNGATPTATTLQAARTALGSSDRPSYVILVTDGAPNCNSNRDGRATCQCTASGLCGNNSWKYCLDDRRTVAAIEALAADGIPTFVIGYDTTEWEGVLNAMAAAGNTGRSYIPVEDQATLQAALADIGGSVISCTYELEEAVTDPRYVRVTLDGVDLRYQTGWELEGERTVRLIGNACDTIQDGEDHTLSIVVECDIVVVI